MRYAVVVDPIFARHATPPGHPERPARTTALSEALQSLTEAAAVISLPPNRLDRSWIEQVHSRQHLLRLEETSRRTHDQLDGDTYTSADSFDTALWAAGSCVALTEKVIDREIDSGFALIRPPGHHAERGRAMGFCLLNNVAIAAQFALSLPSVKKVAIVDFDIHHGNGTQEIFYTRPDVLYLSTHQHPLYPGTGAMEETGYGDGQGFNVNFPIPPRLGNSFYVSIFDDLVAPILRSYSPDLLLVSAGYDGHRDDPLASMNLTEEGYAALTARLDRLAEELCGGRIVYMLEGGYNLAALAQSVVASIKASLSGKAPEIDSDRSVVYQRYRDRAVSFFGETWGL